MLRRKFLTVLFLVASVISNANASLPKTVGNILSVQKSTHSLSIQAENAFVSVEVYSSNTLRLRFSDRPLTPDFSYAVQMEPQKVKTTITEMPAFWEIKTDSFRLEIQKSPLLIRFYDAAGTLLNEDEPGLAHTWIGEKAVAYKKLQEGEKFIGLGEKTGHLDRRGDAFINKNTDFYGYDSRNDPLYSSFPFYIGYHHQKVYGLFLDNSSFTEFNFGASTDRFSSFAVAEGDLDYFLFSASSVAGLLREYSALTGRIPMPPLHALGYQQCRYSYYPDTEVLTLARTFRDKKIPADMIYLDIHYMDAYKVFTWHPERFAYPKKMTDQLHSLGFHLTTIIDPGIKVEKGYSAYTSGLESDMFLKYSDGKPYTGQVWPGWCHFPDFTKAATRAWWGKQFSSLTDAGVDGFWNDMNEPATWGQSFPENVIFDFDGNKGTTRSGRNVYGMQMTRATYEGTRQLLGRRPFLLTRAAFSGSQRYTSIWTGDNLTNDDIMLTGVKMVNSLGLVGMPFAGYDVGGFASSGNSTLYSRWLSIGAFTPFFRTHTGYNNQESDPWSYGERTEEISRNYISLRYRMLPYLYSHFYEASQTGMPINRSLAIPFTQDEKVFYYRHENQFMFGHALLVAPCESNKEITKVYLPKGKWYELHTAKVWAGQQEVLIEAPLDKLPLFARGSSFIPMQSLVQSTSEKPSDTLVMHVFHGEEANEFVYYEDDGTSFDHEKNGFFTRSFRYLPAEKSIRMSAAKGNYKTQFKYIQWVMHGCDKPNFLWNKKPLKAESAGFQLFNTQLNKSTPASGEKVMTFTTPLNSVEDTLNW